MIKYKANLFYFKDVKILGFWRYVVFNEIVIKSYKTLRRRKIKKKDENKQVVFMTDLNPNI